MAKEKTKVEQVIEDINNLSEVEKRELTITIRTTLEGNKAYVAFLYGVGRVNTPPIPVPPTPSPNLPTEKVAEEEQETEETEPTANNSNANDEWL